MCEERLIQAVSNKAPTSLCRRVLAYQDCYVGRDDEVGIRRTMTDAWAAEHSSC